MRPPNDILVFCCVALRFGYANYPVHGWSLGIARVCVTLLAVGICEGGVDDWWCDFLFCSVFVEAGLLAVGRIIQDSMVVIVIVTSGCKQLHTRLANYRTVVI